MRGTLSFAQGIEIEDGDFASRTRLGFGITSATRAETFSLNLGTEIFGDFAGGAGKTFDLINQNAALRYSRESANSRLNFSATYSEVDLEDETIEGVGDTTLISTGSAETIAANIGLEFGVEGPFGGRVDLGRREVTYIGTNDPDLADFETTSLDALANFRIRPSLTLRALAGIRRTDENDATSTRTEDSYIGFGAETSTGTGLTIIGDVLYDQSKVTVTGPATTTEDGLGIDLTVRQARPDGSLRLELSSRIDETGRRTSAEIGRDYTLRNGTLGLSFGVVDQEGDDTLRLIGGVNIERETRRGSIEASLRQDAGTSDGDAVINTALNLGMTQQINNVSSWSAGLGFVSIDELGGTYDNRATASISYTRDLTSDWAMNAGVAYSKDRGESSTNTIFLNIERDFTFGF